MTRKELVDLVYAGNEDIIANKRATWRVVDAVFDAIREAMLQEEDVVIKGVGRIYVELRDPYWHPHPQTQELIRIPPKLLIKLKPNRILQAQLMEENDLEDRYEQDEEDDGE